MKASVFLFLACSAVLGCGSASDSGLLTENIGEAKQEVRTHIGVVYDGIGVCSNINCKIKDGTEAGVRNVCIRACSNSDTAANRTVPSTAQCDYVFSTQESVFVDPSYGEPPTWDYTRWECDCYCLLNTSSGGGSNMGTGGSMQPNPAECVISSGSYCPAWCQSCTNPTT